VAASPDAQERPSDEALERTLEERAWLLSMGIPSYRYAMMRQDLYREASRLLLENEKNREAGGGKPVRDWDELKAALRKEAFRLYASMIHGRVHQA
jgi:hypothetical protein